MESTNTTNNHKWSTPSAWCINHIYILHLHLHIGEWVLNTFDAGGQPNCSKMSERKNAWACDGAAAVCVQYRERERGPVGNQWEILRLRVCLCASHASVYVHSSLFCGIAAKRLTVAIDSSHSNVNIGPERLSLRRCLHSLVHSIFYHFYFFFKQTQTRPKRYITISISVLFHILFVYSVQFDSSRNKKNLSRFKFHFRFSNQNRQNPTSKKQ